MTGDIALEDAVDVYLQRKAVGDPQGSGAGTYAAKAESILGRFADWIEREHGVRSIDALDPEHMRSYAAELRDRADSGEYAASTAETYYAVVRAFLSWCDRGGIIAENPAATDRAESALPTATAETDADAAADADDRSGGDRWTATQRRRLETYVRERALEADRDRDPDERRDRLREYAMVAVLAHSAARGSELFRVPQDDRRTGATWEDVDFYSGTVRVLGKSQRVEEVALLAPARTPLRRYMVALDPPSNDWPLFPTRHAPSIASRVRSVLRDRGYDEDEIESLLERTTASQLARERSIAPPAITTEGARSVLKRLCAAADVDVDGDYLTPRVVRADPAEGDRRDATTPGPAPGASTAILERSTAVPETETSPVVADATAERDDANAAGDATETEQE